MKKIIYIILFTIMGVYSCSAIDFSQYCANEPAQKNVKGTLASVSGFNFMTRNLIEFYISKTLKKELGGNFKVNIKNFYGTNVLNGEFSDLSAQAKEINFNGFYMSNINAQTLCKYNHITYKNDELQFIENFLLKFSSQITQDDLDKTMTSGEVKNITNKINKNEAFSSMFSAQEAKFEIKNNKLYLKYKITPLPNFDLSALKTVIKPINITISSDITAKNGKIKLNNLKLASKKSSKISNSIISMLDPLKYSFKISKNKRSQLYVDNAQIKNNIIYIDGTVYVPKD